MNNGWRRETTIREYTKSGIRGEVVYVAPCGKRFKQYPDIIRVSEGKLEEKGDIFQIRILVRSRNLFNDFLYSTLKNVESRTSSVKISVSVQN